MVDNAMAPNIDASLAPSSLEMAGPGETVEATLTVKNQGTRVDQYLVEMTGLQPGWYTLSLTSISLFPRDQDKVLVKLHPPKELVAKGGEFPFSIKLTSRLDPRNCIAVPGQLNIRAAMAAGRTSVEASPPTIVGAPTKSAAPAEPPPVASPPPVQRPQPAPPPASSPKPTPASPPVEAMVGAAVRASLLPSALEVPAVGQMVEATLTIQNKGDIVDQYALEMTGLDRSWYVLPASSASMFPGDQDQVALKLQPPKDPNIKAGDYPFAIRLTSKADPKRSVTVEGRLTIRPQVVYAFEVAPLRVTARRQAHFRISLANAGNTDAKFRLSAVDREESCHFRFEPAEPTVGARSKSQIRLTVRPNRGWIVGTPKNYDLTISAAPAGPGVEPRRISAQLQHRPLLSSLRPLWRVLRWLVTVGILLAALWFAINYVGGSDQAVALWTKLLDSIRQQLQSVVGRF